MTGQRSTGLALAVLLVLTGCGDSESPTDPSEPTGTAVPTTDPDPLRNAAVAAWREYAQVEGVALAHRPLFAVDARAFS